MVQWSRMRSLRPAITVALKLDCWCSGVTAGARLLRFFVPGLLRGLAAGRRCLIYGLLALFGPTAALAVCSCFVAVRTTRSLLLPGARALRLLRFIAAAAASRRRLPVSRQLTERGAPAFHHATRY